MQLDFNCPLRLKDFDSNLGCSLCKKTLVDCRDKSNEEIMQLQNKNPSFCGVYTKNQISNQSSSALKTSFRMAFLAVFLLGFNATNLFAQETDSLKVESKENLSKTVISGVITNVDGEPIPFAKVWLEVDGINIRYSKSDFEGSYKIEIEGLKNTSEAFLHFKWLGSAEEIVEIDLSKNRSYIIDAELPEPEFVLVGFLEIEHYPKLLPTDPYDFGKTTFTKEDIRW